MVFCGLFVIFFVNVVFMGGLEVVEKWWVSFWFWLGWILMLVVLCVFCEIEKVIYFLGLLMDLIEGERVWFNYVVYNVGVVMVYLFFCLFWYCVL